MISLSIKTDTVFKLIVIVKQIEVFKSIFDKDLFEFVSTSVIALGFTSLAI